MRSTKAPRSRAATASTLEPFARFARSTEWIGQAGISRAFSVIIPSMRVAIDARKLHDFGIGTYIRNLLRHLSRLDRETEFVVFCRPEDRDTLGSLGENFRAVVEASANYSIREQLRIPFALRRERVTLFHAPH